MTQKWIPLSELCSGEYAITKDGGMPVLCLSDRSFMPKYAGMGMVVHIVNGVGAFSPKDKCRRVSIAEAFAVVLGPTEDEKKDAQ